MRSLAQRSATAAREIKQLIQQSVQQVENGSVQAGQTSEVGEAVRKIDAMTQQNAALVEQLAASALSLEEHAKAMDAAVQAFRL